MGYKNKKWKIWKCRIALSIFDFYKKLWYNININERKDMESYIASLNYKEVVIWEILLLD